jgi:predicted ferric reductase
LGLLSLLCLPLLRKLSYEFFLRSHQILAVTVLFSVWRHLGLEIVFSWYCLTTCVTILFLTSVLELIQILLRVHFFWHGLARATVKRAGDVVSITIYVPVPLTIEAGQFISIWIPRISFWSFLQTHPFVVASAERLELGTRLQLMVEPRHGWTAMLLRRARDRDVNSNGPYIILFSGPHGLSNPVADYGTVILAASGWGLMAQLPYLRQLIRGYHNATTKTRRVHLVWQLEHIGTVLHPQTMKQTLTKRDRRWCSCARFAQSCSSRRQFR